MRLVFSPSTTYFLATLWFGACVQGCGANTTNSPEAFSEHSASNRSSGTLAKDDHQAIPKEYQEVAYWLPVENCIKTVPSPFVLKILENADDRSLVFDSGSDETNTVLSQILLAAARNDEKGFNSHNLEGKDQLFPILSELFRGKSKATILHSFILNQWTLYFISTDHVDFPYFPVLLIKLQDGQSKRDLASESSAVIECLKGIFYCLYHSEPDLRVRNPHGFEWKKVTVRESDEKFFDTTIGFYPESVDRNDKLFSDESKDGLGALNELLAAAREEDVDKYLTLLSSKTRELIISEESRDYSAMNQEMQYFSSIKRSIDSILRSSETVVIIANANDSNRKWTEYFVLVSEHGNWRVCTLNTVDAFSMLFNTDAFQDMLLEAGLL